MGRGLVYILVAYSLPMRCQCRCHGPGPWHAHKQSIVDGQAIDVLTPLIPIEYNDKYEITRMTFLYIQSSMYLYIFNMLEPQAPLTAEQACHFFFLQSDTPFSKHVRFLTKICICLDGQCFCMFLGTPNKRRTPNHLRKGSNFVLSSRPDPIGVQNGVRS